MPIHPLRHLPSELIVLQWMTDGGAQCPYRTLLPRSICRLRGGRLSSLLEFALQLSRLDA